MQELIKAFAGTINIAIGLTAAAGLLVFLWGVATFVFQSDNSKSREEGRNRMVWGIIILFVMISVWGLVALLQDDLLGTHNLNPTPTYDFNCGQSEDDPC